MRQNKRYPRFPRPSCHGIIIRDNQVLLVKRGSEPFKHHWGFPGGGVELGETVEEALKREIKEETGLQSTVDRFLLYKDAIDRDEKGNPRFHYVIMFFLASITGGTLKAATDAAAADWIDQRHLPDLRLVPDVPRILSRADFPAPDPPSDP